MKTPSILVAEKNAPHPKYRVQIDNSLLPFHMRIFRCVLSAFALLASVVCPTSSTYAQTAFTEPVGFYRLTIKGASDNYLSLPIPRPPVFAGAVAAVTANTVRLNGATWAVDQFKFVDPSQPQTYYLEFATGNLEGVFYKIIGNTADTLTLDTEGDDLTAHSLGAIVAGATGDAARIRPYWRVRDIFGDSDANLVLEKRPNRFLVRDDIRIPDYEKIGTKKAPKIKIYFVSGVGWRKAGDSSTDMGNFTFKPNAGLIVRRRNVADTTLLNFGQVLVYRSAPYIEGGNGVVGNDTFVSLNHAAPVKLDESGLHTGVAGTSVVKASPDVNTINDSVFVYNSAGFNPAAAAHYYYLAGQGWRQVGSASTTIGQDVLLAPGTSYLVRKKADSAGGEWLNEPNY